jgi:flagellar biosynthesis anti-sigma factor FlgM
MRIGLNTPDTQSVSAEQAKKSSSAATNQPQSSSAADKTAPSQDRVTLSTLASQALGMPEVRHATVEGLRRSVSNGQYRLDPDEIADSILGGGQN